MSRKKHKSLHRLLDAGYTVSFEKAEDTVLSYRVVAVRDGVRQETERETTGRALQDMLRKLGLHG